MYETGRYSNYPEISTDPGHVKSAEKGRNCVCVLADGYNEPHGGEQIGSKVTRIIVENYLRRPALKDEAMEKILDFASSGVLIKQTPQYHVECAVGALMIHGSSFRWMRAGDVSLFHFVDGQLVLSGARAGIAPLGRPGESRGDMIPDTFLGKGENSFFLCSGSFLRYVSIEEVEDALAMAENAQEWMGTLRSLYESRSGGEACSFMTVFVPSRKKRFFKKPVLIGVIAVILAAAVFFGMGALRRRGPRPEGGPGNPPQPPGAPGAPAAPGAGQEAPAAPQGQEGAPAAGGT